jgi:nucleoside-diphosphate-sugar epimerase
MKIFLAGGIHEVGKRVAYLLARDQHEVTAAVENKDEARIMAGFGVKPLILHLLNVNDVQAALYGQEAVCNLATAAWNPKLWEKNDTLRRAISLSLAHGALKNRVQRFVQESSTMIYADAGDQGVTEEGRWKPGTMTASTLGIERNALELERLGTTSVVLRFASAYSADSALTRALLRFARFGYYMQPGSPDGFVSTIHADDAATAVVEALKAPAGVYNVAEDMALIRRESAQALASALGRSKLGFPSKLVRGIAGSTSDSMGDSVKVVNHKFKNATNWKPKYPSPREGWIAVVAQASK